MTAKLQEIRSFTGLRGLAALYVVLYHFGLYKFFSGPIHNLAYHGYIAVDIFFMLSGFVMAMTYQSFFSSGFNLSSYKKFISRRVARVYPLYIVITLISIGFFALNPQELQADLPLALKNITANILMMQAWGLSGSYVGPGWSISTEWAAYIIFPLLLLITLFCSVRTAVISLILCLTGLTLMATLPDEVSGIVRYRGPMDITDGKNYGPLLRCIFEFAIGILTYRFYKSDKSNFIKERLSISTIAALGIIGLAALKRSDILIIYLIPILLLSIANDRSVIAKILGTKPIHWLGVISYSLYMAHVLCFFIKDAIKSIIADIGLSAPHFSLLIAQTGIAVALAAITYYTIERPGRDSLRRILERQKTSIEGNPNLTPP